MEEAANENNPRAVILLKLLDNPPRSLSPLTFLETCSLITIAVTATWGALEGEESAEGVLSQLLLLLSVWLIGAALVGFWGISKAHALAMLATRPVAMLLNVASPILNLGSWAARLARGPQASSRGDERVSSNDIQIIVAEGSDERKIDEIAPEEREMIAGIIEMGGRSARDIMVPRTDVIGIDVDANLDSALEIAAKFGHSRLPVFEGDLDHIVGILHVKDLIQSVRHASQETSLRKLVRPVHYVPDTVKADDLLRDLLKNRIHMAVVVDEYGGTAGLVTIEDALEEIVGEIRDEYDAAEEPDHVLLSDDEAIFLARVSVNEVNEIMAIRLPTEETDTLGGLIYAHLGKLPKMGDHVELNGVELTVTAVTGRRIKKVRVRNLHPGEREEAVADTAN